MPLGTALGSGLQAFMGVREHQRRQQLHDLQVENFALRNEGQGLANEGSRLNNRVAEVKANVAEFLQPHAIREGIAGADKAEQQVLTERARTQSTLQQARQRAGAARVNESNARTLEATEGARINEAHAKSQSAVLKANREHIEVLQDGLATAFEAAGGDLHEALNNDFFTGGLVGIAEQSFGVEVADVRPAQGGGITFITSDGQGYTFSEQETLTFISDTDSISQHLEAQAQNRLARQTVEQEVGAVQQQHADAKTTLGHRRVQTQSAADAIPTLRELDSERTRIRGRIHALEQQKARGFGSARTNDPIDAQISELQTELEPIERSLRDLRNTHGDLLDRSPEELAEADEQLALQMGGQEQNLVSSLRQLQGVGPHSRVVSQATGMPVSEVTNNLVGRNETLGTLSPDGRLSARADRTRDINTINDAAQATVQQLFDTYEDEIAAIPVKDRSGAQTNLSRARRSVDAAMARHPVLLEAASGSEQDRARLKALLGMAVDLSHASDMDVGVVINEIVADRSMATVTAAGEFANDKKAFAGVDPITRYNAVNRMVELMEINGLNATQAKTHALQEMRNDR